jgi:hypothetical protein
MASIYTSIIIPSANYNDLSLWYGNIDSYKKNNLRSEEVEDEMYIEDAYFRSAKDAE